MTRRPGTILLIAVVVGALSAAWVYRSLRSQQRAIEAARQAAVGATVDLVVATETLSIGTRIEPRHVRIARWPIDVEPDGSVRKPEEVVGQIAKTSIDKNQPITKIQLVGQGVGLLPLLISEGMRGLSVKVDGVTGVSGFITPSSRVDVLVAGQPEGDGAREPRSKLILQNVRVIATGKSIEQKDEKPVEVPTVTLLVTPEDAEKLTLATRNEPVRLALRNYRDEEYVRTPGITLSQLFGDNGVPAGVAAKPAAPRRRAAAPQYSVEVFLGDKSTRQTLF
jgi:pilus assembly protein CpaB